MAQGITSLEEIMSVDKRDIIRCNAFSLLMQRGYAKTSYTAIAELSGRKRTLVQYYYPKRASFCWISRRSSSNARTSSSRESMPNRAIASWISSPTAKSTSTCCCAMNP